MAQFVRKYYAYEAENTRSSNNNNKNIYFGGVGLPRPDFLRLVYTSYSSRDVTLFGLGFEGGILE